jgi:hypothetical protein
VAILEMSKLIPQLLRKFEFELEDRLKKEEWKTSNRWFVKNYDFRYRVRLRDNKESK